MTKLNLLFALLLFVFTYTPFTVDAGVKTQLDIPYETVEGDPLKARIYTLPNGLKVYLSVNKDEPRVQTYIAVRAGSKHDPKETTGLAHYLEHMLFKGTSKLSTTDWEQEQIYLRAISDLYEKHRFTTDPVQKFAVYKQIDSLSNLASRYSIPGEYDKMIGSLGATGTNAYTWVEQTVYVNNIPSNELEKWLFVESERFNEVVLRLFHTELETVYEEFNRAQDNDGRKAWQMLNESLFPNHPYGTQTTIGEGEHLKNPSMVNIYNYFNEYYIPNNIAICLAGDLDYNQTIAMVNKYFGHYESNEVPEFTVLPQPGITAPIVRETFGKEAEFLYMGYRFPGAGSQDALMLELVAEILSNGQAGLIDLELNRKQQVLNASAFSLVMKDFSMLGFEGKPREGQKLEDVQLLLKDQIERLKKGDFDDWLIPAIVNNLRLNEIKELESNRARAGKFVDAFILDLNWKHYVTKLDEMEKLTKLQVVEFANQYLHDNYVVIYKRTGEDDTRHKVDKPVITPIELNREAQSEFYTQFTGMETKRLQPVFIDYKKDILQHALKNKLPLYYIANTTNETFELHYILDIGSDHDKELALAVSYLPYLGTSKYTAEQLEQEFFKLGLKFGVNTDRDKVYVTLSGLDRSLEQGIKLFEHILADVQPDKEAYNDLVDGILKQRSDNKKNKGVILWRAMFSFAKYGNESPFTNILSDEELKSTDPQTLVNKIKSLTSYEHKVFYYGSKQPKQVMQVLDKNHKTPKKFLPNPEPVKYSELSQDQNKVFVVDHDMVQAEILMVSKDKLFDKNLLSYSNLFNEYFGSGLTSIVFQEIRESKALAYSAFSSFSTPQRADESHYVYAYVGTQADKLPEATGAMLALMNEMPGATLQYTSARDNVLKNIESERIIKSGIFWNYENARKRGLDYDIRRDIYTNVQKTEMDALSTFFNSHIRGKNYTFLVIGKKSNLDMEALEKLGEVQELKLEEVFGY